MDTTVTVKQVLTGKDQIMNVKNIKQVKRVFVSAFGKAVEGCFGPMPGGAAGVTFTNLEAADCPLLVQVGYEDDGNAVWVRCAIPPLKKRSVFGNVFEFLSHVNHKLAFGAVSLTSAGEVIYRHRVALEGQPLECRRLKAMVDYALQVMAAMYVMCWQLSNGKRDTAKKAFGRLWRSPELWPLLDPAMEELRQKEQAKAEERDRELEELSWEREGLKPDYLRKARESGGEKQSKDEVPEADKANTVKVEKEIDELLESLGLDDGTPKTKKGEKKTARRRT